MRFVLILLALVLLGGAPRVLHSESALPPILTSLELDREEAFVKEQILVTLLVGYPSGAFGMAPSKLQASNAELISLHKSEWVGTHENLSYRFIETKYALFGNSEGSVSLIATVSGASLPVSAGGVNSRETPTIQASIEPLSIAIRKPPARISEQDHWLAAADLTMSYDWLVKDALQPGAPITRRIVINLTGQHPAAVPENIGLNLPDGVRAYPAQAITSIEKTPDGLNGTVVLPVTLVAEKSGDFELPAITLPWWNIIDQQWQNANLPPQTMSIVPTNNSVDGYFYKWLSMLLGLLLSILGISYFLLWRQRVKPGAPMALVMTEKHAWQSLRKSSKHSSGNEFRSAIVVWLRELFPQQTDSGLEQLTRRHPELKELASALDRSLYSNSVQAEPNRKQLIRALVEVRRLHRFKKQRPTAVALYPEPISTQSQSKRW